MGTLGNKRKVRKGNRMQDTHSLKTSTKEMEFIGKYVLVRYMRWLLLRAVTDRYEVIHSSFLSALKVTRVRFRTTNPFPNKKSGLRAGPAFWVLLGVSCVVFDLSS